MPWEHIAISATTVPSSTGAGFQPVQAILNRALISLLHGPVTGLLVIKCALAVPELAPATLLHSLDPP